MMIFSITVSKTVSHCWLLEAYSSAQHWYKHNGELLKYVFIGDKFTQLGYMMKYIVWLPWSIQVSVKQ